jgi:hypothetical protein
VPDTLKEAPKDTDFVKTPTFSWLFPLSSIAIGNANKNDAVYTLIKKVTSKYTSLSKFINIITTNTIS